MEEASGWGGGEESMEFHPPRPPFTVGEVVLWQEDSGNHFSLIHAGAARGVPC